MSGGTFNHADSHLFCELFDWGPSYSYGIGKGSYESDMKLARNEGPFDDRRLNEMLFDMFCLLNALDYYKAGDIGEATLLEDISAFKKKWTKMPPITEIKAMIDDSCFELNQKLYKEFGIEVENEKV